MSIEEFEEIAQKEFDALPERFRGAVENVRIVIAERDTAGERRRAGGGGSFPLLGLYEGIPVLRRGNDYGMYPAIPDSITLYKQNIESVCRTSAEIRKTIRDTLIHEIAHHFGFSEDEIREAGYG